MQVKFRQTTRNGCGSLSIANIFDDARFATGLEDCPGERYADLNKKIQDLGGEIFIDPIFLTHIFFRSGYRLTYNQAEMLFKHTNIPKAKKKTLVVPYLVSLANSKGRNQHMVAVLCDVFSKLFYVIDSTKSKIVICDLYRLVHDYKIVSVALFRMWDHAEPGNYVTLDKLELTHIFTP